MKELKDMTEAEISQAIKDEIPCLIYRDIYRPVISERLAQNHSYTEIRKLYAEAAKGLREVLGILDEQPETASQFPDKKAVFNRIMELMRILSDFECAELIGIVREEEKTGRPLLKKLMEKSEVDTDAEYTPQKTP